MAHRRKHDQAVEVEVLLYVSVLVILEQGVPGGSECHQ